jgi:peroxiredoxin
MTSELARLDRKYKSQGLALLSVTSDAETRAREVVKDWKIPYAVASDGMKQTFSAYSVTAIPVVFIIGKKGKIREVVVGNDPAQRQATEKLIKKLLAEK